MASARGPNPCFHAGTSVFGHEMDPAKLRGAPLGWYFPLFFLIQALMPGGFALGFATSQRELRANVVSQISIIAAGIIVSALIFAVLLRSALVAKGRVRHFEEAKRGRRAEAQVLGVEYLGQAGTVKSGGSRRSYVKLRVRVRAWFEDRIPFELNEEARYTMTEKGKLELGPMVWLHVHPAGGPFLIDPESLKPQLPPGLGGPQVPQGPQIRIQPTGGANRAW